MAIRSMSWSIAVADTTWEIPAATSRLRLTLRWNATTTDRSYGAGWSSDWAWATTKECAAGHGTAERRTVRSVEEQQAKVAAAAVAPRPVRVAIAEAQGLMCAEEVVTERPLPGFDQAAIDGYAVRSVDVLGVASGDDEDSEEGAGQEVSLPVMG